MRAEARRTATILVAAVLAVTASPSSTAESDPAAGAPAGPGLTGRVEGRVVEKATGRPVPRAVVTLPAFGIEATTTDTGFFSFPAAFPTRDPYRPIRAVVRAPAWGVWTIDGAPLLPNDTLRLNVELRADDWSHRVTPPGPQRRSRPVAEPRAVATCTGWQMQLAPPKTIKVWMHAENGGKGASEEYDFLFYVTHVLPNEWLTGWHDAALAAGAVAVRTYGAYRTMRNNAYKGEPDCADVIDTAADQVFDPTWSAASTDQGVYESYGSILWRDGGLFLAQYFAGESICAPVEGQYAGRMSQWGTEQCAIEGMSWPGIVTTFYENTDWHYLHNLMINPDVENNVAYPWLLSPTASLKRIKLGAYAGIYYYELSTTDPPTAAFTHQDRPYSGDSTTEYQLSVALRCPSSNTKDCIVKLRVIAHAANGDTLLRQKKVTVAEDGVWRFYTFKPLASGINHSTVEAQFLSVQTIGIDDAELKVIG